MNCSNLYEFIKKEYIEKQIQEDLEEKLKYSKQIIKKCKEEYRLDDEVIMRIFKRIYYNTDRSSRLNKYNKDFMVGIGEVWNRNNIKTKKDIEKYYKSLEDEIVNIIGRDLTSYEKISIEDLIYRYKVKERDIIDTTRKNKKLDINKLKNKFR